MISSLQNLFIYSVSSTAQLQSDLRYCTKMYIIIKRTTKKQQLYTQSHNFNPAIWQWVHKPTVQCCSNIHIYLKCLLVLSSSSHNWISFYFLFFSSRKLLQNFCKSKIRKSSKSLFYICHLYIPFYY